MFYIHGGDFMRGASNLFPGHVMAAFYEVVVVTINYRLGALGKFECHSYKLKFSRVVVICYDTL
jgi:carboxylesterase type B